MKILYISNSIIPSRTANSIHVMKMCQSFAKENHQVILLAPDRYKEYEFDVDDIYEYYGVEKNFKIEKVKYKYVKGKSFFQIFEIFKIIKRIKPDLVYGRYTPGCAISSLMGYKTIFESHSPVWDVSSLDKVSFFLMRKARAFSKLVVISDALKEIYLENKYINSDKIYIAHDGADIVENFNNKIKLKGEESSLKIGYVGHMYQGRGIEIIIECAKKLSTMSFHLVGGTEEDINYWKKQIKKENLKNIFFYGFVSPKESISFRNSFDIMLAPYSSKVSVSGNIGDTSSYMSPLKIFEYMSHKKAIICSDLPVLREVLNDNNSLLVPFNDSNKWISALIKLEDTKFRNKISEKAYSDFSSKYTWHQRAKNLLKNLES